jgi:hypothetical protein
VDRVFGRLCFCQSQVWVSFGYPPSVSDSLRGEPIQEKTLKKKPGTSFIISVYIEEVRQEQQLLLDGVYEMMDLGTERFIPPPPPPRLRAARRPRVPQPVQPATALPERLDEAARPPNDGRVTHQVPSSGFT